MADVASMAAKQPLSWVPPARTLAQKFLIRLRYNRGSLPMSETTDYEKRLMLINPVFFRVYADPVTHLDFIDVHPKLTGASQLRVVKLDKWDPDEVKEAADENEETMQKEEMEKMLEEQKKAAMSTSMPVESSLKEDEKKEEQPHEDSGGPESDTRAESNSKRDALPGSISIPKLDNKPAPIHHSPSSLQMAVPEATPSGSSTCKQSLSVERFGTRSIDGHPHSLLVDNRESIVVRIRNPLKTMAKEVHSEQTEVGEGGQEVYFVKCQTAMIQSPSFSRIPRNFTLGDKVVCILLDYRINCLHVKTVQTVPVELTITLFGVVFKKDQWKPLLDYLVKSKEQMPAVFLGSQTNQAAADVLIKTNNSRLVYLSDYLVVRKIADRVQAAPEERPNVVDLFKWQSEQNAVVPFL